MKRFVACLVVLVLAGSTPLFAGKQDKSKGKSKGKDGQVVVTFTVDQREAAQAYFVKKHGRGKCPPGLAKKGNGCLPPGQAKKRYAVGQVLPKGAVGQPPPEELSIKIGAPPEGYTYLVVDGDLVKLVIGTMIVIDAIEGIVD